MPEAAEAALGCIVLLDPVSLGSGVEHLALTKSRTTHPLRPRIEYLETRAQYQALEDGVSDDVWEEAVSWLLDNPSSSKTLLESSYDAWIAGDFEADIAVLWPPNRAPIVVAAFITQCIGPESKRAAMLADIGELVRTSFS